MVRTFYESIDGGAQRSYRYTSNQLRNGVKVSVPATKHSSSWHYKRSGCSRSPEISRDIRSNQRIEILKARYTLECALLLVFRWYADTDPMLSESAPAGKIVGNCWICPMACPLVYESDELSRFSSLNRDTNSIKSHGGASCRKGLDSKYQTGMQSSMANSRQHCWHCGAL